MADRPRACELWALALNDIDLETLDAGFDRLFKTWVPQYGRKFPVPGELRAIVDGAKTLQAQAEAEKAWDTLIRAIESSFTADFGWLHGKKPNEKIMKACTAAGGTMAIFLGTETEVMWAKRRFIEAYLREDKLLDVKKLTAGNAVLGA